MEGVLYIIDQAGHALARAEQQNAALRARVAELEAEKAEREQGSAASQPAD